MNDATHEPLYDLLPAIHRIRDDAQGKPLLDLMRVLGEQQRLLEEDIARLYDNWFIETCDEWVVPYIGDLLGVRPLNPVSQKIFSQRAWVANTLGYRRRKGTLAVLEQLARDVTGWPAKAVEFFELLGTTQSLNHTRPQNLRTPDLRNANRLEQIDGPFDRVAHTVEVRRIASGRGRFNIPNIGLFLFRLQSYPLTGVSAHAVDAKRFLFSPLGLDMQLFNAPQPEAALTQLAGPHNVEMPVSRRMLHADLASYYPQSVRISIDGAPIPGSDVLVCNLSDKSSTQWAHTPPAGKVALDPKLGRIALGDDANAVAVNFHYGFSGDVGGGPYARNESLAEILSTPVRWQPTWIADVQNGATSDPHARYFGTLSEAIADWNTQAPGSEGVLAILDSQSYDLAGLPTIEIPEGSRLLIVAGSWPDELLHGTVGHAGRTPAQLRAEDVRPHLQGDFTVAGTAVADSDNPGEVAFNGLLIEGGITVQMGNLAQLRLHHCTLVPPKGALQVAGGNPTLRIELKRSICGPVTIVGDGAGSAAEFVAIDTILHAPLAGDKYGVALAAVESAVQIENSTLLGSATVYRVEASNSIFIEPLRSERRQIGCVRYSYVPSGSRSPRRFHCQPDLALLDEAKQLGKESIDDLSSEQRAAIAARLIPAFTSRQYGQPTYAQLSNMCAEGIRHGADDGSEMGVFCFLKAPLREANLQIAFEEYLNFGLEAGIIYVT